MVHSNGAVEEHGRPSQTQSSSQSLNTTGRIEDALVRIAQLDASNINAPSAAGDVSGQVLFGNLSLPGRLPSMSC
jgi:hypothetical protein